MNQPAPVSYSQVSTKVTGEFSGMNEDENVIPSLAPPPPRIYLAPFLVLATLADGAPVARWH